MVLQNLQPSPTETLIWWVYTQFRACHSFKRKFRLLVDRLWLFYNVIHPLHCTNRLRETKRLKDSRGSNREMNYSRHYNTVIFVDCEGLSPRSDAGLTDKAPPSSAACSRNRTPADGLETQQQTCPIDLLHFLAPNMSQHGQQCS